MQHGGGFWASYIKIYYQILAGGVILGVSSQEILQDASVLVAPDRPPTFANTGADSAQPTVALEAPPAPGAPAASVAPPATTIVAAAVAAVAPATAEVPSDSQPPSPPPSPPATASGVMGAAKSRALAKRPRSALLKTPQILMSAERGSPTAEGDAVAESEAENGEDNPCEEEEEEHAEEDGGKVD